MAPNKRFYKIRPVGSATSEYLEALTGESGPDAAARKTADNGILTRQQVPGPLGMTMQYTANLAAKTILFEGDVPDGTTLQIGAVSGTSFLLGNSDNQSLQSQQDYPFGPTSTPGMRGQWAMGPRSDGSGGIPNERLYILLKNAAGVPFCREEFTPKTQTQVLFALGTAPTPTGPLPTQTPTASPTPTASVFASSIGFSSIVSYDSSQHGGLLQLRGVGSGTYEVSFEGVGQALSLSNPDSPTPGSIPTATFLGNGPGETSYPLDWTLWGVTPGVQLRVRIRKNGGTPDVYLYTPANASRIAFTAPGTGTATQSVTVAPTQSPTQSASQSPTVSPSATLTSFGTPLAGAHDWTPFTTAVPANGLATLETATLKIDLDLREGTKPNNGLAGGIRRIVDKATGRNMINVPVYSSGNKDDVQTPDGQLIPLGTTDTGRGINECLYRDPAPWTFTAPNGVTYTLRIGDNPNESGDVYMTPSHRLDYGHDGTTMYTEIDPNQWDANGLRLGDRFRKWIRVEGNMVKMWSESRFNRTVTTGSNNGQGSRLVEAPCAYVNGSNYQLWFYDGDQPYTGAPLRYLVLDDNIQQAPGTHYPTENFMAAIDPATGRGIGIIMETPSSQIGQMDGKFGNADGTNFGANYMAWFPRMTMDKDILWRHSCVFVVGTLAEIRQRAYELTYWKPTMEFRFNQAGRQLWSIEKCNDPGYVSSRSSWPITFTNQNYPTIYSPAMAISGAIKKHYIRYRYNSPGGRSTAGMYMRWIRARQSGGYTNGTSLWNQRFPDGAAVGGDYELLVNLIADNQWHVAEFDTSGKAEWKNIISEVRFQPADVAASAGETWEWDWISANPGGPAAS